MLAAEGEVAPVAVDAVIEVDAAVTFCDVQAALIMTTSADSPQIKSLLGAAYSVSSARTINGLPSPGLTSYQRGGRAYIPKIG